MGTLQELLLSNNGLNGTRDVGDSYSSDLNVDLTNIAMSDFTQQSTYNMTLNLASNPICEGVTTGSYCATGNPNIPKRLPSYRCNDTRSGSNKLLSPYCTCAYPYIGTMTCMVHDLTNFLRLFS